MCQVCRVPQVNQTPQISQVHKIAQIVQITQVSRTCQLHQVHNLSRFSRCPFRRMRFLMSCRPERLCMGSAWIGITASQIWRRSVHGISLEMEVISLWGRRFISHRKSIRKLFDPYLKMRYTRACFKMYFCIKICASIKIAEYHAWINRSRCGSLYLREKCKDHFRKQKLIMNTRKEI